MRRFTSVDDSLQLDNNTIIMELSNNIEYIEKPRCQGVQVTKSEFWENVNQKFHLTHNSQLPTVKSSLVNMLSVALQSSEIKL